jgi:outer membrane receptor protein involved in Fe transport
MLGLYGQTAVELTPWLRLVAGLRADHARFQVDSLSAASQLGGASDHPAVAQAER